MADEKVEKTKRIRLESVRFREPEEFHFGEKRVLVDLVTHHDLPLWLDEERGQLHVGAYRYSVHSASVRRWRVFGAK